MSYFFLIFAQTNIATVKYIKNHHFPLFLRRVLLVMLLFCAVSSVGQTRHEWEKYLLELMEMEDADEDALADTYDVLCELEENPLNINTATYDDFSRIPVLSITQISDLIEFRERYGELKTMEELAMIKSIDTNLRLFLSCFFVAEKENNVKWYSKEGLKSLPNRHNATVISSVDVPFYTRKGYKTNDETGEKTYLGDKYKYNLKYTGKFSNAIKYGFVMAKDAGEPVFSHGNNAGMDYYSYYVSIQNLGRLKQLVIGNYRLRFGMGLVMNTNSNFGKQTMLTSISTVSNQISGHTSRNESAYLRGAAATVALARQGSVSNLDLTAFYSYRDIDATLNDDGSISTISSSGYHRTLSEMSKKSNAQQMSTGLHLAWKKEGWHLGLSGVYDWLNRDLNPHWNTDGYKYRKYSARGNQFWNIGADYGYLSPRFSFTGETATGDCGSLSSVNALQTRLGSDFILTAIQRFYSYKYYALHSNSFSDGGTVQNESGLYLGVRWNLGKYAVMDAYSDLSYSPWLKYQVHASSYSWDNSATMQYERHNWNVLARYRMRLRQRDNADKTALFSRYEHRGRFAATHISSCLSLKTQADLALVSLEANNKFGWMIGETAQYKAGKRLDASFGIAYFNTDDYDSRIYSYEKSLLYSFSIPTFWGEGLRLNLVARSDLSNHWMLMGKLAFTKYFDRENIGTAYQQIDSSYQTDLSVQLRYKF